MIIVYGRSGRSYSLGHWEASRKKLDRSVAAGKTFSCYTTRGTAGNSWYLIISTFEGRWILTYDTALVPILVSKDSPNLKQSLLCWMSARAKTNPLWCLIYLYTYLIGARGGAVGWGTALQAGRSRVRFPMMSLGFFIDIILPAALWPWGWLSL